jgi:hypothetical protein
VKIHNERLSAVAMGAALLVAFGGASAVAAGMVTSADIKDDTVRSRDVRDDTIRMRDLTAHMRAQLAGSGGETTEEQVDDLSGEFGGTNGVSMTPDGAEMGPYADGGSEGGSVFYTGLNGETLNDVQNLVYYARYTSTGETGGVGVPYLRIFTEDVASDPDTDEQSTIFSPNTQMPDPDMAEGPFHEWVATSGTWRYNDDAGNGSDQPLADIKAAHGDEVISGIYITTGGSAGQDLSSLLRSWQINGTTYNFGS